MVEYGMIGEKVGMTRVFSAEGLSIPVTVVKCGPCYVVQKKEKEKEGYEAIQIGYNEVKEKKLTKPLVGHLKKKGAPILRKLVEFRVRDISLFQTGQVLKVTGFKIGDQVDVTGQSKGKGFAGVVKRYGYRGGAGSHGSTHHRAPGSIGGTDAERVWKGKTLPGRMGNERVTTQNLKVVGMNEERDLLLVKGAIPGAPGCIVLVRKNAV
ncbi:MAG: 50S ribosomal protein L3 [Atribacterota bacterium]|nr:50S ribosomal protein L3 [Candidatus Atribacteria bacterium]